MIRLLPLLLLLLLLSACKQAPKALPPPQQSHEIVVVTYNSPTTYYVDGNNAFAGLEYDLAKRFASELGADFKVRFLVVGSVGEVIPALLKGQAHFAAAGLDVTHVREHLVRFGSGYQQVQPQVVVNNEKEFDPKSIRDLVGKLVQVPKGSSDAEHLSELVVDVPELHWLEAKKAGGDELLEKVAEGTLDATIADDHLVSMVQNYYPNLDVAFNFGQPRKLAWAFPKDGNEWLYQKATTFFENIRKDGTLRNLQDRYYGHSERLNTVDVTGFLQRMRMVLPQYVKLMKQAQASTNLDWRLLAALSYQESHWDTYSTSPTNVRGLMMLTEDTADKMGVTNRLDPAQSIMAGAKYLLLLKGLLPEHIQEPDRTWLALASYNVGFAHVEDARILAQRMKLNPDAWADVKKTLPLLNQYQHFSNLKFGFARGGAAVIFVESIRTYYKILEKYEDRQTPTAVPPRSSRPKLNLAWVGNRVAATP